MNFSIRRSSLASTWGKTLFGHGVPGCFLVLFLILGAVNAADTAKQANVFVVQLPAKALVPDAIMDSKGVVHVVYGLEHNAWYVNSSDNGKSFSTAVKVNSTGTVETEMGERGPKIALGQGGSIHIVWVDDWAPGVKTFVRYSRSVDGGKTFASLQTLSGMSGVDGATLAADEGGHVAAFWHTMTEPKPAEKSATWVHTAQSTNNGASFEPSAKVVVTNFPGLACSMCMMRARSGPDGKVHVAFRSAQENVRDFYVLKGDWGKNEFTAERVNKDNWKIDFCPMCGPELTFGPGGEAVCAFMSRNKVYWTMQEPGGKDYALHVSTPASESNEIYPSARANRRGEVLFLWQVGPMAVKGTAIVKWALYDRARPTDRTERDGWNFVCGDQGDGLCGDG